MDAEILKIARGHESEFVIARDAGVKSRVRGACPVAVANAYCAVLVSRAPFVTLSPRSAAFCDASALAIALPTSSRTDEMRSRSRLAVLCASEPDWATSSLEQALRPSVDVMSTRAVAAARVRRFIVFLPGGP